MAARRQRAVVTGGAGFLGSHLCERLLADGYEVICLDNFVTGTPANVAAPGRDRPVPAGPLATSPSYVHVAGDGRPGAALRLAGLAGGLPAAADPHAQGRLIGTLHTLGLAREKGARFVLASTSEAYGDPLVHPQPETYWGNVNPVGPRGVYDEAKRFAEAMTMAYRRTHGVDTGIVRIFNTYGPRMRPDDGRAIPTFIRQALAGEPLTVAGDGLQTRSVCYVDDLVEGIVRLARSPLAGPVNIGNPQELTVLALAERIRDLVGAASPVEFVPRPQDDPTVRQPDIALARAELGWEPRVPLDEGLKTTIAWMRDRLDEGGPAEEASE